MDEGEWKVSARVSSTQNVPSSYFPAKQSLFSSIPATKNIPEYVLITKERTYEKTLVGDVCKQLPTRPGGVVVVHDSQLKVVDEGDCVELEKGLAEELRDRPESR
jgi:hypothetical protein